MKSKWMIGTALAVALSAGSLIEAQAAPAKKEGKTLLAQAKGKRAGKGKRAAKGPQVIPAQQLEKILGKPLTDEQKKGIADAANAYNESVAKALGLTIDELKAKVQEYRKNNPGRAGAKKAA
jgi:hypothetical protein